MKKIITLVMCFSALIANAQENPQIANGDFEDWSTVAATNHAPAGWNSFETADGSFASLVKYQQVEQSSDVRPGSAGTSSARIYARAVKVFGSVVATAQGNLTTGRISAGAMTANDSKNHNYSDVSSEDFSSKLGAMPDSIVFWAKFNPGDDKYKARFSAYIHDTYNYVTYSTAEAQAADTENASHLVAKAELNIASEKDADGKAKWVRYSVPFSTEGCTATSPDYILVNFSTSSVPGEGNEADELFIDDVELVYKSEWTFSDMLTVNIGGQTSVPMPGTINVSKQANGKYTMTMKNFVLRGDDSIMPIGTITLTDVEGVKQPDGTVKLTSEQSVLLEEGDDPDIDMWLGPLICSQVGAIPVSLDAVMGEKLVATIDIDLSGSALEQKIIVNFGNVADGIGGIKVNDKAASDAVYNLAGQRVGNDYKGVVVVKGRKILR
jgi:hypothetical protein